MKRFDFRIVDSGSHWDSQSRVLVVEPGSVVAFNVTVLNLTRSESIEFSADFTLFGPDNKPLPGLASVESTDEPVSRDRGDTAAWEGSVSPVLTVATGQGAPAVGTHIIGLRVRATTQSTGNVESALEQITLRVEPSDAMGTITALAPISQSGFRRAKFTVEVANLGNGPSQFGIRPVEDSRALRFEVDPPVLNIPAGGRSSASVTATAKLSYNDTLTWSVPVELQTTSGEILGSSAVTMTRKRLLPEFVGEAVGKLLGLVTATALMAALTALVPLALAEYDCRANPPPEKSLFGFNCEKYERNIGGWGDWLP